MVCPRFRPCTFEAFSASSFVEYVNLDTAPQDQESFQSEAPLSSAQLQNQRPFLHTLLLLMVSLPIHKRKISQPTAEPKACTKSEKKHHHHFLIEACPSFLLNPTRMFRLPHFEQPMGFGIPEFWVYTLLQVLQLTR